MSNDYLNQLRLLQLSDSALPIGATAHSFGLETLVAEGFLTVPRLSTFMHDYIKEVATPEGLYCRLAHRQAGLSDDSEFEAGWLALNTRLSALKLSREGRSASATLGKRLLKLAHALEPQPRLQLAFQTAAAAGADLHHTAVFGLIGGLMPVDEALTVLAYLQQTIAGLISACQRLLPLGQKQAAQLLWQLKPALLAAAQQGQAGQVDGPAAFACPTFVELAGMRHPNLTTRLFIS